MFDGPARKSTSHRRRVRRRFDKDSMSNEEAWLREAAEYQERDAGLLREKKELRWGMVLEKSESDEPEWVVQPLARVAGSSETFKAVGGDSAGAPQHRVLHTEVLHGIKATWDPAARCPERRTAFPAPTIPLQDRVAANAAKLEREKDRSKDRLHS